MLEPSLDYRPLELRQLCLRVKRALAPVQLGGRRLTVTDLHPHFLPAHYTGSDHVHSYYEGHVVLEGVATYTHGRPQTVGPGASLLHGPRMPHSWRTVDATCLRLLFWFDLEPRLTVTPPEAWPTWPVVLTDIALLLNEAAEAGRGWEERANARITAIVSRLLTLADWPDVVAAQPEEGEERLSEIVDQYFHDNLDRDITLAEVADHAGLSVRSLCRHYLQQTGVTVMDRLQSRRMDTAARLLADTHASINDVAVRVGFSDPSNFCRVFRRYYRTSPGAYRRGEK